MSDFIFPSVIELLKERGVWLKRSRSQHFLRDQDVCTRIAELFAVEPGVTALEIGTGLANLTWELSRKVAKVLTVELDPTFEDWHRQIAAEAPNIEFLRGDFLDQDLPALMAPYAGTPMVAGGNLPYQITAPILFRLMSCGVPWRRVVVMVQEEVADRIAAGIGSRRSSAITYKVAMQYKATVPLRVSAPHFVPPPRVQSAVLMLEPLEKPIITSDSQRERAFRLVEAVFQHRRRTLANAMLLGNATATRADAETALRACDIDPQRRPETLQLDEVLRLSSAVFRE